MNVSAVRSCGIVFTIAAAAILGGVADADSLSSSTQKTPSRHDAIATNPVPQFIVQLHRGAGNKYPENTLESFELAWRMNAVPECDVRTSKDGVFFTFHDEDFSRLVPDAPASVKTAKPGNLTWEQLAKLDVGAFAGRQFAGQHIPKLTDVFAAMQGRPDRRIYLDVKEVSLARMAKLAKDYHVETQTILTSDEYRDLQKWRVLLPTSKTLLWMGGRNRNSASASPRWNRRISER